MAGIETKTPPPLTEPVVLSGPKTTIFLKLTCPWNCFSNILKWLGHIIKEMVQRQNLSFSKQLRPTSTYTSLPPPLPPSLRAYLCPYSHNFLPQPLYLCPSAPTSAPLPWYSIPPSLLPRHPWDLLSVCFFPYTVYTIQPLYTTGCRKLRFLIRPYLKLDWEY